MTNKTRTVVSPNRSDHFPATVEILRSILILTFLNYETPIVERSGHKEIRGHTSFQSAGCGRGVRFRSPSKQREFDALRGFEAGGARGGDYVVKILYTCMS